VRQFIAARKLPVVEELKKFFEAHRQKDWTAELSQYISFALLVDGPPDFKFRYLTYELPPDASALEGLPPLIARFYRDAGIAGLWRQVQPAYEQVIARYHEPVTRALFQVTGYLRAPTSGYMGRRFQIYVDLLGAPNQIQNRAYRDDYYVVVTPSPEPQVDDIRHQYLHYLLDPLATKYSENLTKKKAVGDYALGAPYLEDYYKSDFLLLATECLIKAIESRLTPGPPEKKQALVRQALLEGFVLTPHFAEQLPVYEKQEQAMRLYFPELIDSIDFKREEQRLENVEFSNVRPVRKAKEVPAAKKVEPTGPYKTLTEAEQLYAKRDLSTPAEGDRRETAPRQGLLRPGADRRPAEGPRAFREALPKDAGAVARSAGESVDLGLSREIGRLGRQSGAGGTELPCGPGSQRRVGSGAKGC
jgi:hypothetical protein